MNWLSLRKSKICLKELKLLIRVYTRICIQPWGILILCSVLKTITIIMAYISVIVGWFTSTERQRKIQSHRNVIYFSSGRVQRIKNYIEQNIDNNVEVLPVEETLRMAKDALEKDPLSLPEWHIIGYNCESFATWLKTGKKISAQVENSRILGVIPLKGCCGAALYSHGSVC